MNLKNKIIALTSLSGLLILTQNFMPFSNPTSEKNSEDISNLLFSVNPEEGFIRQDSSCIKDIGRGGNYREGSLLLKGKCEGGGIIPRVRGSVDNKYIQFRTSTTDSNTEKDRSELAYTDKYLPFGDDYYYIGFKLMIPKNAPISDKYFYLMQLWQNCPGMPPIAGIRVERGNPYSINFMTRGEEDAAKGSVGFNYKLVPDQWHSFVLRVHTNPTRGTGDIKLWADHQKIGTFRKLFGYGPNFHCPKGGTPEDSQSFRLKFGIYKGPDLGKKFEVRYDDIKLGKSFSEVKIKKNE